MTGQRAEPPAVAVIVPVHGVEEFVVHTLESIRAQGFRDWECVVVDDGSPDSSVERAMTVIVDEPRMRLVQQPNAGVCAARNTGLAHVSPGVRFIAFVDADDTWLPGTLADLVAALEKHPAAVGSFGFAESMDGHGRPVAPGAHSARQRDRRRVRGRRLEAVPADAALTFDEAVVVGPVWPPAVALQRRSVVVDIGPFDTAYTHMEDWDFFQRMLRHGDYVVVPHQVAWYRQHPGQVTGRHLDAAYDAQQVRRKTWSSALNTPAQRRAATWAFRQLQFRETGRAAQRLVRALARRQWRDVLPLLAGTAVLAWQNVAAGPPDVTRRQLVWSRRVAPEPSQRP